MNVLLHIRANAEAKPGGDYDLLKMFAGLLSDRGHRTEITLSCDADLAGHDVVLTINLDNPFEPALMLDRAQANRTPTCIYSLHRPTAGIAAYLRFGGASGGRRVLATLSGCNPQRYIGLLSMAREALGPRWWRCAGALRTSRLQDWLLRGCSTVLVSSEAERTMIAADFPRAAAEARFAVVPHVFSAKPASFTTKERDLIVCPGRVESGKNQLALLAAAPAFPRHRFVFAGSLNHGEPAYVRRFTEAVARTPNASYAGFLPRDQFRALLARAAIAASASWFEVASLAEVDAVVSGCRLVAGCHSYLREFVGDDAVFFDPAEPTALIAALSTAIAAADAGPAIPSPRLADMAPASVGRRLEEALVAAIAAGR